jgi:hypothetical protein
LIVVALVAGLVFLRPSPSLPPPKIPNLAAAFTWSRYFRFFLGGLPGALSYGDGLPYKKTKWSLI